MSDRTKCPNCGKEWGSHNFPLWKCDNCQTVFCSHCRRSQDTCHLCQKGRKRRVR